MARASRCLNYAARFGCWRLVRISLTAPPGLSTNDIAICSDANWQNAPKAVETRANLYNLSGRVLADTVFEKFKLVEREALIVM